MPRNVSVAMMQAALSQETDEVLLTLLEITHPNLGTPFRLVNDYGNITHGGNTYTGYPFRMRLPDDREDREPVAELALDNTDRLLIETVRSLASTPAFTIKVVLASSPNTVEWGPITLEAKGTQYSASEIRFELGLQAFTREPFPWRTFNPREFPGLYK